MHHLNRVRKHFSSEPPGLPSLFPLIHPHPEHHIDRCTCSHTSLYVKNVYLCTHAQYSSHNEYLFRCYCWLQRCTLCSAVGVWMAPISTMTEILYEHLLSGVRRAMTMSIQLFCGTSCDSHAGILVVIQ